MELKDSQTWKNFETSLFYECLAYCEYYYYSQQAHKDDYIQVQEIFLEAANNELHHAKLFFKKLHGGEVPPTLECLELAKELEHLEWHDQYDKFAEVAKEEGFEDEAAFFHDLAGIEKSHQARFEQLIENINNNEVFKRDEIKVWYCTVCGYIHVGKEAPLICPVCQHDQGHFEIKADNY